MKSNVFLVIACALATSGCFQGAEHEKGFQVTETVAPEEARQEGGIDSDSLKFETQPGAVLLTGIPSVRLATIFKVNVSKRDQSTFIGTHDFHYRYEEPGEDSFNSWHGNLMPGLEAVYGYNLVNIAHYNVETDRRTLFFEKPVLIRTVYYPTFDHDTLNGKPVNRNYFLVSAYDEDTNKDGFINLGDLRRFYFFNLQGELQKHVIPRDYAVMRSEYDPGNDLMFVFARLDQNADGQQGDHEPIHVFWVDFKDPSRSGLMY